MRNDAGAHGHHGYFVVGPDRVARITPKSRDEQVTRQILRVSTSRRFEISMLHTAMRFEAPWPLSEDQPRGVYAPR